MPQDLSCACTALRKASRALTRLYDEALSDNGMTVAQFALLRHIARAETIELSRLADGMVMDRTSLYRALTPLERAEWITIEKVGHGRAKQVTLTPAGRKAMLATVPAWNAAQTRVVENIGLGNWTALQAQLANLSALATEVGR